MNQSPIDLGKCADKVFEETSKSEVASIGEAFAAYGTVRAAYGTVACGTGPRIGGRLQWCELALGHGSLSERENNRVEARARHGSRQSASILYHCVRALFGIGGFILGNRAPHTRRRNVYTPAAVLLMLFVFTRDGYSKECRHALGLHRAGIDGWGWALAVPLFVLGSALHMESSG